VKKQPTKAVPSRLASVFALFIIQLAGSALTKGQAVPQGTGPVAGYSDDVDCEPTVLASPYIPLDSWIYPAVMRLYSLGYADTVFLNMRPWTRASVRHMMEETADRIDDDQVATDSSEPARIYNALMDELNKYGRPDNCRKPVPAVQAESVYTIVRGISGTPLRDSFHLGATIVNDYGRPYAHGFNNYTGASGYASAGRYLIYARGELQAAPSSPGYSPVLAAQLANIDMTTFYYSPSCWANKVGCKPIPYNQHPTIPAGPLSSKLQWRFLEAYVSAQFLNHIFSFGKQDYWDGPAVGASMAYSNNAENIYSFRINRQEPLQIPLLSRIAGPFRYEFMVGPLKGHVYPKDPWVHVEKVSFSPTRNIKFGFERTVIWGGKGHVPITVESFARSFFSLSAPTTSVKNSSKDPGARFGAFDFSYRLPFLRDWLTLYTDSEVHDDLSPIDAPRRASWRPGLYLSHMPYVPKLDLRVEAAYTDPPITNSHNGTFMYWENIQRDGYTNSGQIFGDWIGREAKGGQGWLTYHLSGNEWLQLNYRYHKVAKDFIPGGTTLQDVGFQAQKRLSKDLEIIGNFNYQGWKAPFYLPDKQPVTTTGVQLTWYPRKSYR
jgi:Capsule assembly protein Wzi